MMLRMLAIMALVYGVTACQGESNQDAANIAAAKAGYDAFAVGDMEAWAKTQSPEVKWAMPKGFPYGGNYVGADEVIEKVFAPIGELWPDFKVEPVAFHAAGNVVFIETKMTTGGQVSDSIHKAVIENGQYVEFQVFDDAGFMMSHAAGGGSGAQIGTQFFEDGSSKPLFAGNSANAQIWVDYIQAHNDRDFEQIAAMNADGFRGITAQGEVVEGSAAQTAFLQNWVAAEKPQWQVWWVIANDGENAEGDMEEWLATGTVVTNTSADGTQTKSYETIDVLLEDGKIKMLNVASQRMPQ
jgi:ketosteroid isomerase-like protein